VHNSLYAYDNDTNGASLQGIAIDHALVDVAGKDVDVLNFLGGNILTLGEFKDIFRSVDDFDGTVGVNLANVTSQEPTFFVESLSSLISTLVVASCHCCTLHS